MKLSDFTIGGEFMMSDRRWRCTDIGTRVIVAIRLDGPHEIGGTNPRTIDYETAEAEGWFKGPPYAVLETVIDEDSMLACWNEEHPLEDRPIIVRRHRPVIGPAFYQD